MSFNFYHSFLSMIDIHKIYNLFQKEFGPKRMQYFARLFNIDSNKRVLDVGGTLLNWSFLEIRPRITILNISPPPDDLPPDVEWIVDDARSIPFDNGSFDIVFSNSVIEHLGNYNDQKQFAQEIRRVGRKYFVQTPNFFFPIEAHLLMPFIHWLPRNVAINLLAITPRSLIDREVERSRLIMQEVRLLKPKDMAELFPDSKIVIEKVLGFPKSIIAIKV